MTETAAETAGGRRSDRTRAAILTAARERFAADGYERATIRAIAADATIDPAMVMRYFGNKEKLFAAAAEFDLRLPDLSALPGEELGAALTSHFLDRWEGDESLKALLRASVTNEVAADRMRELLAAQLGPTIAKLSASADGASSVDAASSVDVATRAGLVATQALGFALCRYVLALPPVANLSREEAVAWLGPTITRYLIGTP
ncbi:TetR family transcriptional regulator [Kribbella orskensis]|uniref:TetR family transcriptional regulator n=1 Tax=Kribbella orskensis TaxID=2512216 RepID=A0ABY2BSW2_9ACTN|nr:MULTISPECIES: TetR family transcriptional regulator [Kribbella]TCN39606.1 TetR family transcriptional regulator [Kribbella sp. VKM Ac-2500]TCO27612.1 TetR family transcriptional regulator [Kribbella orskensis]